MKRGRKRRRGRPKGSRNKLSIKKDTIKRIGLTCKKCKRYYTIRTDNLALYTEEIKKNWICPICKIWK